MLEIKDKKDCTSCFACYNICPKNAIVMKEDEEGFKYPKIDKNKCINCGLCEKVCPIINRKSEIRKNYERPKIIAAWSKDNNIRLDSTSGGVFSEIAKKIYNEGGYVCGAIYNKEWLVEHYISKDIKDLERLRSSKYLQSDMQDNFRQIKKLLETNNKVLICGSPCQISGLYNFLNKDYENLYTLDFICRGMNSPKIFKGYIQALERKYKSEVINIKFKHKIHGWHNFSTKIDFKNGKTYIGGRYEDSYMIGYLKYNAFMRPSCYDCKFKELPRKSDITLADFWGIEKINPKLDQNKGTSMILINSNKGEKLFEAIKEELSFEEIKSERVFKENVCMKESVKETEERKKVFDNIDKFTYDQLSKKYFPEPPNLKKIEIKIMNSKLVNSIKNTLRPIYRRIKGDKE